MAVSREMTLLETQVLNTILQSASFETPIQARVLQRRFNLSKRKLEIIIESLKVNFGHPVVAKKEKPNGYFLPKTKEERDAGLAPYKRQILTEQKNLAAVLAIDLDEYNKKWRSENVK